MKICPNCGKEVENKETTCPHCGQNLTSSMDQPPVHILKVQNKERQNKKRNKEVRKVDIPDPNSSKKQSATKSNIVHNPNHPKRTRYPSRIEERNLDKNKQNIKKKRKKWILITIGIILILATIWSFFYVSSTKQSSSSYKVSTKQVVRHNTKPSKKKSQRDVTKLTVNEKLAYIIGFGAKKYHNNTLEKLLNKLQSGKTEIFKVNNYTFNNLKLNSDENTTLYEIDPQTGVLINNQQIIYIVNGQKQPVVSFNQNVLNNVNQQINKNKLNQISNNLSIVTKNNFTNSKYTWSNDKMKSLEIYIQSLSNKNKIQSLNEKAYLNTVSNKALRMTDTNTGLDIGWNWNLQTQLNKYMYNVVAVFNIQNKNNNSLYLFCIDANDNPMILVGQNSNSSIIILKKDTNQNLNEAFISIASHK